MLVVREATDEDVESIREIFVATYGQTYTHPQFYDRKQLRRMIYGDDTLLLVAEDPQTRRVVGTASVIVQIGAHADLVGEFGRLAVDPNCRGQGCGRLLMEERIRRVEHRLHLGLVENRCVHTFSQQISASHGFVALGFVPLKMKFDRRESVALYGRHFGDALGLRRNHPHIIPEVYQIAHLSLANCGLTVDAIVEHDVAPYPHATDFELEELTTEGYTRLLRFQRGRIKDREIFGPIRLHYGLFQIQARHSNYLIARRKGQILGGLGYLHDEIEQAVRVFEVVSTDEEPIHFLFRELVRRCQTELDVAIIEVDVSAYSPKIQRTLSELEFVPAAYVPSMVFHDVERLDAVKMIRLLVPCELGELQLHEPSRPFAAVVTRSLATRQIQPRIAAAMPGIPLFRGLDPAQSTLLAAACELTTFAAGEPVFTAGEVSDRTYIVLTGDVQIEHGPQGARVGTIHAGECLGETSLLNDAPHSATARAMTHVEAAVLTHRQLREMAQVRPDLGVVLYRNLALGLSEKLNRLDRRVKE